jgi:hypothetical protein
MRDALRPIGLCGFTKLLNDRPALIESDGLTGAICSELLIDCQKLLSSPGAIELIIGRPSDLQKGNQVRMNRKGAFDSLPLLFG